MVYSGSARRRLPMPWKESSAMEQRIQLIADWLSGDYSKSELCRGYGISRPTADKWIERYGERGVQGLEELSRVPHTHPNQTPEELRAMIVETKLSHQRWGPKKVVDYLGREQPEMDWPVDSTAGEILKRAGLVQPRAASAPGSSLHTTVWRVWGAESELECGLQGRLSAGQRTALLSADPQRQLLSISAFVPGA